MKHALLFLCLSATAGVLFAQPVYSTAPQDKVMVNRSFANNAPRPQHRPPPPEGDLPAEQIPAASGIRRDHRRESTKQNCRICQPGAGFSQTRGQAGPTCQR